MPLAEDELVSAQKQVGVCQRCRIGSEEGRKRGERGGGRWKQAEENEAKKVKNVNLNGQKAQEYEEM